MRCSYMHNCFFSCAYILHVSYSRWILQSFHTLNWDPPWGSGGGPSAAWLLNDINKRNHTWVRLQENKEKDNCWRQVRNTVSRVLKASMKVSLWYLFNILFSKRMYKKKNSSFLLWWTCFDVVEIKKIT